MTVKDIIDMDDNILLDKYEDVIKNGDFSKCDQFDDTVLKQQLRLEIKLRMEK